MNREIYNIINPVAGGGKRAKAEKIAKEIGGKIYYTVDEHDIERFVISQLEKNPYTHFVIYGGDGSLNCCVNGIMKSGCNKTACFTAFSLGSGNDFLTYMKNDYLAENKTGEDVLLDVIEADGRYSINILNTGFDCTVVSETDRLRKKHNMLGGKLSYTIGVLTTLFKKKTFRSDIVITNTDGSVEKVSGDYLLLAVCNCQMYGGGYKAAPVARPDDGILDLVYVTNIPRLKLLSILMVYKTGAHIIKEQMTDKGVPTVKKFDNILTYRRCRSVEYDTAGELCYDGEIHKSGRVKAQVIDKAIRYVPMDLKSEKVGSKESKHTTVAAV